MGEVVRRDGAFAERYDRHHEKNAQEVGELVTRWKGDAAILRKLPPRVSDNPADYDRVARALALILDAHSALRNFGD